MQSWILVLGLLLVFVGIVVAIVAFSYHERDGVARSLAAVEAIFAASPVLGQGNPAISRHPMSRSECRRIRLEAGLAIRIGEMVAHVR